MSADILAIHNTGFASDVHASHEGWRPLRVMILSEFPHNGKVVGGVQSAVSVLCNALSQNPGIARVDVVDFRVDIEQAETVHLNHKLTVHHLPAQRRFTTLTLNLLDAMKLDSIVRQLDPDIVHAQGLSNTGFLAVSTGIPAVVTVHGVGVTEIFYSCKRRLVARIKAFMAETLVRFTLKNSKSVIVPSVFAGYYYKPMHRHRFMKVPNAVRYEFVTCPARSEREKRIVFTGVVIPIKNVAGIIRAFVRVKEVVPEARLDIVGPCPDTDYKASLDELISSSGLSDVHFLGNKDAAEIAGIMSCAAGVVVFSHHENVPCVIPESLAVGTPVVASRVGGIPEMIEEGITGYLVDPGDEQGLAEKLIRLLKNPDLCNTLGSNARRSASRWHPATVAEATVKVYRKALSAGTALMYTLADVEPLLVNTIKEAVLCL